MNPPLLGECEETFLMRITRALSADVIKTPRPSGLEISRLVSPATDLVARFVASARAGGMLVETTTGAGVESVIARLIAALEQGPVAIGASSAPSAGTLARAAAAAGRQILTGPASEPDCGGLSPYFAACAGLTDVVAAVAETGSIVLASSAGRGGYLVPPTHIALVLASQIVADLLDLTPRLRELAPQSAALTIVSGPSKTADIEGVLVTGVHGPGAVYIVLVTDA